MRDQVAVRCRQLRKTYDRKVEALRGLDLTIYAGQCYGLLGPNGAGKTTAIEILEGLLDATSGEVEILGCTWRQHPDQLREAIGVSLQETRLAEKLSVRETLELFGAFYRSARPVGEVLDELALSEKADAWVGKLSGGQKQRLAIATALVGNPRILFLDEPTTGLDPQSRRQVWEIVRRFQSEGGTVLLTTHYMDEAERLCDYISIIDHGKVIAAGTPPELISGVGGHHRVEFALASPACTAPRRALAKPSRRRRSSQRRRPHRAHRRGAASNHPRFAGPGRAERLAVESAHHPAVQPGRRLRQPHRSPPAGGLA